MTAKGIYIYGIVPNLYSTDMFRSLEGSGVYAIPYQNISAIVSDMQNLELKKLDRETLGYLLVQHQKTVEDLQNKGFSMLIPMKLGKVVESKQDVIKILTNGYDLIISTLQKIENLLEIDLVTTWGDFQGVLQEIAGHPDIASMKSDLMKKSDTLTEVDHVSIGMLVQEKLKEKNTKVELNILDSLSSTCTDIKVHEVMNDEMVTNSALLIKKNKQEMVDQIINQLDEEYKGLLNFKLVGPLPCYSFYTMEVNELDPEHVSQAMKDLGLREETSETEIKKAYLEKTKLFHPDAHLKNGDKDHFNRINKAYHTMLNYSAAARQLSKDDHISLAKEKIIENLILVKIKD